MPEKWVPLYQIDAFTSKPFGGNPAAVCIMSCGLNDSLYLNIAEEMNLSETAFSERVGDAEYKLRWFTPAVEVLLCGHATLATAHALFEHEGEKAKEITFHTLSGALKARKTHDGIQLNFPRDDPEKVDPPMKLLEPLGVKKPVETFFAPRTKFLLVVVDSPKEIIELKPNFSGLLTVENPLGVKGICVTAKADDGHDFVSRFFGSWVGVNENPVTGSAHTVLMPYWTGKLGTKKMRAYQASKRGGELTLEMDESRVYISGEAATIVEGKILIG